MPAPPTLNTQQQNAVRYIDGPLLVIAGAGSGKTRVITEKIAHLVYHCDYKAFRIAAITFTNKAAQEMADRLAPHPALKDCITTTFHALGLRIMREEAHHLDLKKNFSILNRYDTTKLLAEVLGHSDKSLINQIINFISQWKNLRLNPEEINPKSEEEVQAVKCFTLYNEALQAYQAVDFDDLVCRCVTLLETQAHVREQWQRRLGYILVDEYQDTNPMQYAMLKVLSGARAAFTVVGDDDQSIYAWRGADIMNIQRLGQEYPNLKTIVLEQNYRSSQNILQAANHLINVNEKLISKSLWSALAPGDPVKIKAYASPEKEAESIVMNLIADRLQNQKEWHNYAVLYRANYLSRPFEEQLRSHSVPYTVSGGQSFFDRPEIKDVSAYLRLIVNADDDLAFLRVINTPKRGIGMATLQKLGDYARKRDVSMFDAIFEIGLGQVVNTQAVDDLTTFAHFINRMTERIAVDPPSMLLPRLLTAIDYEVWLYNTENERVAEQRWQGIQDFIAWVVARSEDQPDQLSRIVQWMMISGVLDQSGQNNAVHLSTLHAAKGLEFDHVWLIGLEEELLPHRESSGSEEMIAEERRLVYVGMTRAKQHLALSYCQARGSSKQQNTNPTKLSRFIEELGDDVVERLDVKQAEPLSRSETQARLRALRQSLR